MSDALQMSAENQERRKPDSLTRLKAAARKLFVEGGYHATRPQDIAREAGLGHGTFYLHYPDKQACFLGFVEDARQELDVHVRSRRVPGGTLEEKIGAAIAAIVEYSETRPGVLRAAMADERVIDGESGQTLALQTRWAGEWADLLHHGVQGGTVSPSYDAAIIGHAIVGAIAQVTRAETRGDLGREGLVENLTRFLIRALRPD